MRPVVCVAPKWERCGVALEKRLWHEDLRALRGNRRYAVKSRGFTGTLTNTSLHDVIQLICIGRSNCRMHVKNRLNRGLIGFRDGEIVHAQSGVSCGEEAFFSILSWEIGIFECDEVPVEQETISESWDFLLMESLRRLDTTTES